MTYRNNAIRKLQNFITFVIMLLLLLVMYFFLKSEMQD